MTELDNNSGRWTAEEIRNNLSKEFNRLLMDESTEELYQKKRDEVFYSADKAVLKEDILVALKNIRTQSEEFTAFELLDNLIEELSLSKSEEALK